METNISSPVNGAAAGQMDVDVKVMISMTSWMCWVVQKMSLCDDKVLMSLHRNEIEICERLHVSSTHHHLVINHFSSRTCPYCWQFTMVTGARITDEFGC